MEITKFNIRVYGIFVYNKQILLSREYHKNRWTIKFPGGGLEFGEGPIDCLKREIREELGMNVRLLRHFYTLDFYQVSALRSGTQLLSIFYLARFQESLLYKNLVNPVDYPSFGNENIKMYWRPISKLTPEEMTFPGERHVVRKLLACACQGLFNNW